MFRGPVQWTLSAVAPDVAEFAEVLTRWVAAESGADTDSLAHLLGAGFRGDDPLGFVLTKDQWLGRYRTGALANTRFAWRVTEITLTNGTAVATGIQTQTATYHGSDCSGRFRAALVAVKDGGRWSIVNVELSRLTETDVAGPERDGDGAGRQRPPRRTKGA